MSRWLEAWRTTLGSRHPDTLASINNMASLLQDEGNVDEREFFPSTVPTHMLYRGALEARLATLGYRHLETLSSISNMARLLDDQGKLDNAESLLRKAVDASSATLAEGHRTRLRAHGWLADVYRAQGKV